MTPAAFALSSRATKSSKVLGSVPPIFSITVLLSQIQLTEWILTGTASHLPLVVVNFCNAVGGLPAATIAFSVVMAPAPPPPAMGTSFQTYPSLTRPCFRTFSAAASPPEVHQCSICTSLTSAAFAVVAKPRTEAAIALVNNRLRSFIVFTFQGILSPTGFGPAPFLEAL